MATTIREDNTHFDHAFIIGTGNVERQTLTSVAPHRRSDQSTARQKPVESVSSCRDVANMSRTSLTIINNIINKIEQNLPQHKHQFHHLTKLVFDKLNTIERDGNGEGL